MTSVEEQQRAQKQFNLADLFELVADTVPGRAAVVADPDRRTYAELDERATRFGNHLRASGVAPGAHVGILARNRIEWVEAMIGCYKARAVPVNLNFRYVAPELRYVIENADLEVLVYERALAPLVAESLASAPPSSQGGAPAPLDPILGQRASDPSATVPAPVLISVEDGSGSDQGDLGAVDYDAALAAASPARTFEGRSPDDLYLLFTGGTTGMPKGVMWRQEDIFFAAMGGNGWGGPPVERPSDVAARVQPDDAAAVVMLVAGPLMHGNAQWAMWNGLFMGGTVVLYTEHRFDPHVVWRLVERERVVSMALVGDAMARPLAEALATSPPGTYDTSSVFVVGSGGAMLTARVKDELRAQLPDAMVTDRFGSSEGGAQGAVDDSGGEPRFVMSDDTAVLDDDLRPLAPGDGRVGRLARRGRIPLGYYKDEHKTAATFPVDASGTRWSVPGDLASVAPDGTIIVHGRGSSSINTGGEKVFPEEVEVAVKAHPDVYDAIVVGVPDDRFGEQVAVLVRVRDGASLALADIQLHCRSLVAGYKVPRRLVLVDEIPLTAAGKPDAKAAKALLS